MFKDANAEEITVSGATRNIFVFVKFWTDDGPHFKLYRDAAATHEYESHQFVVPAETTCAIYFWLTADSNPTAEFEDDPCKWESCPRPKSVTYEYMMAGKKSFSMKVNNWSFHPLDEIPHSFELKVVEESGLYSTRDFEVDPTILEKGGATPPGG